MMMIGAGSGILTVTVAVMLLIRISDGVGTETRQGDTVQYGAFMI